MKKNKQTALLVLGMHRSGTSALTGTLGLLDIYLGSELMQADVANEKGYFENNILYTINEKLLAQIQSSWDDLFYTEEKLEKIDGLQELKEALSSEFKYADTFAIKDPRLAFLFPIYQRVLDEMGIEIKILLPYRNPFEVASSLFKRDGMPLEKGMLLWAYHFLLTEKFSRGYQRVFIGFDHLIENTSGVIDEISHKLEMDLSSRYQKSKKNVDNFLEPGLKHHNISMNNLSENMPELIKEILTLEEDFNTKDLTREFDRLYQQLFSYQKLFYNESIVELLREGVETKNTLLETQKALGELHAQIQTQNKVIEDKEQSIQKQNVQIQTQNNVIQEKEQSIQKQNVQIQTQNNVIQEKEQSIQKQNAQIQTQNKVIQDKERELRKTTFQKDKQIDALQQELTQLYMSKSWKLTKPLRWIVRKLYR